MADLYRQLPSHALRAMWLRAVYRVTRSRVVIPAPAVNTSPLPLPTAPTSPAPETSDRSWFTSSESDG